MMKKANAAAIEPVPMRLFICKVASRCNLNCDYCYVYNHVDQSWRSQPVFMPLDTARQLGRRISEHCRRHDLTAVDVVLHGGEPLSAGLTFLNDWCAAVAGEAIDVTIRFRMQTNGVLFDERAADFCLERNITVGLSCDGDLRASDRHRRFVDGRSSFAGVERAIRLLSGYAMPIWSGFLTVIDLDNSPLEVYSFLKSFAPRSIELLLPLAHHEMRPAGKQLDRSATPYADWLIRIFDVWFREVPQSIRIRRFRDIIALMAGSQMSSEEWGLQPVDFVVVESDGTLEAVDTLKTTFPGASKLGMNLYDHNFDDLYEAPLIMERMAGWANLCSECQECELVKVCGGGYFPHRYSRLNGFDNPSVYCADLKKLIYHIHRTVSQQLHQIAFERT